MTYGVLLVDPPWLFRTRGVQGTRHASNHYDVMRIDDICKLQVPADDNCAMFLWATWPNLMDAFRLIEAWNFTYRTIAWVWVKKNKKADTFFTGLGYYTRSNTEPCLLAVRGRMKVQDRGVQSLIVSRIRAHSQKPDEQYEKIERLYPEASKLEMFARQKREGWHSWGNEIESDVRICSR